MISDLFKSKFQEIYVQSDLWAPTLYKLTFHSSSDLFLISELLYLAAYWDKLFTLKKNVSSDIHLKTIVLSDTQMKSPLQQLALGLCPKKY